MIRVLHLLVSLLVLMASLPPGNARAQTRGAAALPQLPIENYQPESSELEAAAALMDENQWGSAVRTLSSFLENNPDHLEARYYRAIARRERAAQRTLRAKVTDQWEKGIADFEFIVRKDSSYRDALYQYARFSQVQKRLTDLRGLDQNVTYKDAIRLGHAQIRHRPDAPEHLYHLFTFYRRFVHQTDIDSALAWLRSRSSEYAAYFVGEGLRLDGRLEAAENVLADLPEETHQFPRQAIFLSRAKVHYALDQPQQAQQFVEQAIDQIDTPIAAAFMLEDFKYVMNDRELATYRNLRSPAEYRQFFSAFWVERNLMPARQVNTRLAEHYDRLRTAEQEYWFDGLRLWRNNPDQMNTLEFPTVYSLNHEFNDKGLVYIRHGEPDDRIVTVEGEINTFRTGNGMLPKEQSPRASWVPNESWRYTYAPMDFHFVIGEGATGNNWRLVPTVTNFHMLTDREMWGGAYRQMAQAARDVLSEQSGSLMDATSQAREGRRSSNAFSSLTDFTQGRDKMMEESREAVHRGLTTDRHTWPSDISSMEIPHTIAAFRGPEGRTDLQIHYVLPVNELRRPRDESDNSLRIEAGYVFHDSTWQSIARDLRVHTIRETPALDSTYMFETSVPADSYHVAIHGRALDTDVLGGYKFDAYVPDFSGEELSSSDLLLAHSITPATDSARATRGTLEITVNPLQRFSVREPLFVYFEIYRLTLDDSDQTEYTLEYSLSPRNEERGFFGRLFGGGDEVALSLENTQTGQSPSPVEYAEIDISEVDPGEYTFTVTITDNHTDQSVQRSRDVTIAK
jgi:tetratricopeptide (TPR) repeat protein